MVLFATISARRCGAFRCFSAGERLRIALARGLLTRPQVLLLDEMESHLDGEGLCALDDIVRRFEGTIAFVTHQPARAGLASRVLRLSAGEPARISTVPHTDCAPVPGATTTLRAVT